MTQARDRLADAKAILGTAHPAVVVSAAYYGCSTPRAALSERDEFAKTHSGTWTLFSQIFVASGEFDQRLGALAPAHEGCSRGRRLRGGASERRGSIRFRRRRCRVHLRDRKTDLGLRIFGFPRASRFDRHADPACTDLTGSLWVTDRAAPFLGRGAEPEDGGPVPPVCDVRPGPDPADGACVSGLRRRLAMASAPSSATSAAGHSAPAVEYRYGDSNPGFRTENPAS